MIPTRASVMPMMTIPSATAETPVIENILTRPTRRMASATNSARPTSVPAAEPGFQSHPHRRLAHAAVERGEVGSLLRFTRFFFIERDQHKQPPTPAAFRAAVKAFGREHLAHALEEGA